MSKKILSTFSLVMINIIAVDSLRSLPIAAEFGFGLIFFYLLAAVTFLIPIALITAELATAWPNTGGIYVWVREAFGNRSGFFVIWMQWIYNVVWYPTIMSFIVATIAYLFDPALTQHSGFMLSAVLVLFWATTFVNMFGMRTSSFISSFGAVVGTLLPMALIIGLGAAWVFEGKPLQIVADTQHFLPNLSDAQHWSFLVVVLFGLVGLEMSAVHAEEVKNPSRNYPQALLISAVIILTTLILSSLAIAMTVPHDQLNVITGLLQAFSVFFNAYHMPWLTPVMAVLIVIGSFAGVSAWVIGPTKGLWAATCDGSIPPLFQRTNKHGVPVMILLLQGVIFSLLCSVFILMPTVNSSYWFLSALTAQLSLLTYIVMFAAAIRLRYKTPNRERPFLIPGGNWGIWLVGGLGMFSCLAAIVLGFTPPDEMHIQYVVAYEISLVLGLLLMCAPPFIIYALRKDSWALGKVLRS